MLTRLYTVAANAFVETIRQPIYGVILLATALLLVFNVSLAAFTLDDDDKLLLDLGLNTLLLSGLFLAAFSAASIVSREIENKTVLTVISKPVGRPLFIVAKFAGLTAALVLAFYLSFLVFILCQRHGVMDYTTKPWDGPVLVFGLTSLAIAGLVAAFGNYFYGWYFSTTALAVVTPLLTLAVILVGKFDAEWNVVPFASKFVGGQVLIAAYLVLLAVVIMAAIALAVSTRFGQMMTLLICTAILGLGVVSDYVFGQYVGTSTLANLAYHVVPNLGPFWVIDGLMAGTEKTTVPLQYVGYATAYAALFTSAVVALAVAAFQRREVG